MKNKQKVAISIFLILTSLLIIYSLKTFSTGVSETGQFILVSGSALGLITGIGILYSLVQFAGKTESYQKREEQKNIEEIFTEELFRTSSLDKAIEVIKTYKEKSILANTLSRPEMSPANMARKLLKSYSQTKVRRTVEYLIDIGKGYEAVGTILRHLIDHKKLSSKQAYVLEKELGGLMPKRDLIGLYEKI